jgi:mono/diheme cytochrome c family protein
VKWYLLVLGVGTTVMLVASGFLLTGPHMYVQPHIRTYEAAMPPTPAGAVPVEPSPLAIPSPEEAAALQSPVAATAEGLARGKTYYQYYCLMCHGDAGAGDGPVAESFIPVPSDLRTPKVGAMSDGQLLRAMLLGEGHEPVLGYTVLAEHRWYLVAYVRGLATEGSKFKVQSSK